MIERTKIKDFYGKILGYVDTDTVTGNKVAYNFYNKILGRYNKREDRTRDFYGKIVSRGDTTQALVVNDNNNPK